MKKICAKCGIEKDISEFSRDMQKHDGMCSYCKKCVKKKQKEYFSDPEKRILRNKRNKIYYIKIYKKISKPKCRELKIRVINAYGGQCACCGETLIDFLQIDHIDGNGHAERRELRKTSGERFYKILEKHGYPQKGYQVLCANCNISKYYNRGVCIHKLIIDGQ